jgi:light-regulated signal transduction histidine kinase (bacteriophytochrome)
MHLFNNWLQEKENDNLSAEGKSFLTRMNRAVGRMTSLIDDILILSRMQRHENENRETDLNNILEQVKAELCETIQQKNAVIVSESLPVILGSPEQLVYLFKNILSNALKFQPQGAVPHISIESKKLKAAELPGEYRHTGKEYWKIDITDNGIGFEQKDAQKIFHIFQRLHGLQEYTGTGMGLTISKKVMENHGGFITAEGRPGSGATFSCYFPLPAMESKTEGFYN